MVFKLNLKSLPTNLINLQSPPYSGGSWVPAGMDLALDFLNNRSYKNDTFGVPSSVVTDLWSGGPLPNASNVFSEFAPNSLAINDLGLWTQPQRTNLNVYLKNVFSNWGVTNATRTLEPGTFLGLFDNAARVASNGGTVHRVSTQLFSVTSGVVCPCTIWYKRGSSGNVRITTRDTTAANDSTVTGDVSAPVFSSMLAGSLSNLTVQPLGNDIYRAEFLWTPNFTGSASVTVGPFSAVAGEDIVVLGGQVAQGPTTFSTQPILTSGSSSTRTGNRQTMSVPNGGRAFVTDIFLMEPLTGSSGRILLNWSDGTAANRYALVLGSGGTLSLEAYNGTLLGSRTGPTLTQGRNTVFGVVAPNFLQLGRIGSADGVITTNLAGAGILNQLSLSGAGYNTANNTYTRSLRFGEFRNVSNPTTAFSQAKIAAQEWAAL